MGAFAVKYRLRNCYIAGYECMGGDILGQKWALSEAASVQKQTYEQEKAAVGEEHPDLQSSMANLASTYRNQRRWKEAEELRVEVMETAKRVLDEKHPDTLISIDNLEIYQPNGSMCTSTKLNPRYCFFILKHTRFITPEGLCENLSVHILVMHYGAYTRNSPVNVSSFLMFRCQSIALPCNGALHISVGTAS